MIKFIPPFFIWRQKSVLLYCRFISLTGKLHRCELNQQELSFVQRFLLLCYEKMFVKGRPGHQRHCSRSINFISVRSVNFRPAGFIEVFNLFLEMRS